MFDWNLVQLFELTQGKQLENLEFAVNQSLPIYRLLN